MPFYKIKFMDFRNYDTPNQTTSKRAYLTSSYSKASMSVEACIVLPIFVFAMLSLIYIMQIINVQTKIQGAIHNYSVQAAKYSGMYELKQHNETMYISDYTTRTLMQRVLGNGIGATTTKALVLAELPDDFSKNANIVGGNLGIHFYYSTFFDGDTFIDIVVTYKIALPFGIAGDAGYNFTQRARVKSFATITNSTAVEREETENEVYITQTGTVYHTNRYCTYINIGVKQVEAFMVAELRNNSGAKYYACERCITNQENCEELYITDYGTRYHIDINCSSLKRGVLAVPYSEVKDRRLCSRCEGG